MLYMSQIGFSPLSFLFFSSSTRFQISEINQALTTATIQCKNGRQKLNLSDANLSHKRQVKEMESHFNDIKQNKTKWS